MDGLRVFNCIALARRQWCSGAGRAAVAEAGGKVAAVELDWRSSLGRPEEEMSILC